MTQEKGVVLSFANDLESRIVPSTRPAPESDYITPQSTCYARWHVHSGVIAPQRVHDSVYFFLWFGQFHGDVWVQQQIPRITTHTHAALNLAGYLINRETMLWILDNYKPANALIKKWVWWTP